MSDGQNDPSYLDEREREEALEQDARREAQDAEMACQGGNTCYCADNPKSAKQEAHDALFAELVDMIRGFEWILEMDGGLYWYGKWQRSILDRIEAAEND